MLALDAALAKLAERDPVKARVALKLIKTGMDTKAVLARFEQERQPLAMSTGPDWDTRGTTASAIFAISTSTPLEAVHQTCLLGRIIDDH